MKRYARPVASVGFIHSNSVAAWMVIRTDEVPPHEVIAQGFQLIPDELTDAEVMSRYGVAVIYQVTDKRMAGPGN